MGTYLRGLLIASVFLAACGGGGGDGTFSSSIADVDPAGVWEGSITNTTIGQTWEAIGVSISTGEVRFGDEQGASYVGQITVDGTAFTGNVTAFAPLGFVFSNGSTVITGTITGQVTAKGSFSGSYTLASGDRGSFGFTYNVIHERDSSLSLLAGTWEDEFGDTYTIDSQGAIFGQDSVGCVYSGNVSLIDADFNSYRLNLGVSNCPGFDGNYVGLGVLDDFAEVGDNRSFVFQVNNGNVTATTRMVVKL